jgi:hypothetical protein
LNEPLQLLRLFGSVLARLLGSDLKCDGKELFLVAIDVRTKERENMVRRQLAASLVSDHDL